MLDVVSANKGLLLPRVSLLGINDVSTIPNPAVSLVVYNTNVSMIGGAIGFWYWNGTQWVRFSGALGTTGNTGATGLAGTDGANGLNGATGAKGDTGVIGATGNNGTVGTNGSIGATGNTGDIGSTGATGTNGITGAKGFLADGTALGNTPYWNGSTWVLNSNNIFNNGHFVGIGTAAPNSKLEIGSPGWSNSAFKINPAFGGTPLFDIAEFNGGCQIHAPTSSLNIGGYFGVGIATPTAMVDIASPGWSNPCLRITPYSGANPLFSVSEYNGWSSVYFDGYVGIGQLSPAYRLDVAGEIQCVALHQTSDSRFKNEITNLTNALTDIVQLQGVSFNFDTLNYPAKHFPKGKQIGLIAQDVETVFPELVATDSLGVKNLNYIGLIPVLIESIKELHTVNNSLNSNTSNQEAVITSLQQQLNSKDSVLTSLQTQINVLVGQIQQLQGQ